MATKAGSGPGFGEKADGKGSWPRPVLGQRGGAAGYVGVAWADGWCSDGSSRAE